MGKQSRMTRGKEGQEALSLRHTASSLPDLQDSLSLRQTELSLRSQRASAVQHCFLEPEFI